MSQRLSSRLILAFLLLVIVGCFLPWEIGGDFFPYETPGIAVSFQWVYTAHARWTLPTMEDHGGFIVLLLSLVLMLSISLQTAEREPMMPAILLVSALLAALSLGHLVDVVIRGAQWSGPGVIRAGLGLLLVCIASLVSLGMVLIAQLSYQRETDP